MKNNINLCPCGKGISFNECCALYLDRNQAAPNAETLMRSRYTAYTLLREDYLLATWHPSTRPSDLELAREPLTKWIGLEVKRHEQKNERDATVEFVAKYKINGKAHLMHEVSRFVQENGKWFYVAGEVT